MLYHFQCLFSHRHYLDFMFCLQLLYYWPLTHTRGNSGEVEKLDDAVAFLQRLSAPKHTPYWNSSRCGKLTTGFFWAGQRRGFCVEKPGNDSWLTECWIKTFLFQFALWFPTWTLCSRLLTSQSSFYCISAYITTLCVCVCAWQIKKKILYLHTKRDKLLFSSILKYSFTVMPVKTFH